MTAITTLPARQASGFTLIELMIVIVIATVLISIAVPSYQSSIRKSRRTEARTALLDMASREERFNSTNTSYTSAAANLGYTALPLAVGGNYYQLSVMVCAVANSPCTGDTGTGSAFLLTATPINSQLKDVACGAFTLDQTGVQKVTGTAAAATCWN